MPIYEFCCRDCEHRFEELTSSEAAGSGCVECPKCGSQSSERLISSFCFKSSGGGSQASLGQSGCDSCSKSSCASCG